MPFGSGHQIQHLVDTVAEINIPSSARLIHDLGSARTTFACVAGQVAFAMIGLYFRDYMTIGLLP